MTKSNTVLTRLNLPVRDAYDLPSSSKRFADGGQYRIEIPSTEGPRAVEAVMESAMEHSVPVHRISQGSGIMLQTDDEIRQMVALGKRHAVEICLFVGPRASWDVGVQAASSAGRVLGASLRGGGKGIGINLVGKDGKVIKRYAPADTPAALAKDIEAALAA